MYGHRLSRDKVSALGFLDFGPGQEVRGVALEESDAESCLKLFAAVRSELRSSYWRVSSASATLTMWGEKKRER